MAATLAIGSLSFSLLLSLIAFGHVLAGWAQGAAVREAVNFTWFQFGTTNVDLGWILDPLSAVMLVMVSFVGLLIFIYSIGYMAHDENYTRFFCFLSLFAGAMLGVVISNSILLLFMCWEIVGLTSYLLIGFWYQKPAAAAAAKKAFLTTRVGDIFFLLGIVWLFAQTGTLLFYNNGAGSIESGSLTVLLTQPAALVAVAQNDIKRILAYSTISQLGYMMAGLGMGGVAVGMFHLITHAFFKALLFMGAGSVIHGCHEEQDIRRMGGLRADMPLTFLTYAIGMLALCGFPLLFSGFWSKDGILEAAVMWHPSNAPFIMLVFGALLTAFYMTRQVSYVFFGTWRSKKPAHESPAVMTAPLAILAFFAMALGLIGTPVWPWFRGFIESRAVPFDWHGFLEPGLLVVMAASTVLVFLGLGFGWWLYCGGAPSPEQPDVLEKATPLPWIWLRDRLYIDELYGVTVVAFYAWWAHVADWLDRRVWGGVVAGVAWAFRGWADFNRFLDTKGVDGSFDKGCEELASGGGLLSRVQNGRVQTYLRILAFSVVALVAILIWSSLP